MYHSHFLQLFLHPVTMTNQVHIKNDVLLAHHFFIYNTYFPYHIWIVVGYNNNLVQASHSFLSKTVFAPFSTPSAIIFNSKV